MANEEPKKIRKFLRPLGILVATFLASTGLFKNVDAKPISSTQDEKVIGQKSDNHPNPLIIQRANQSQSGSWHQSHYSHSSHYSHGSHDSHSSHYSHYSSRW